MPHPVVQVRGLERSFPSPGGEVRVLRGIDLEVDRGELVCLVGPNGSGKSTLLRILAGLDRPDAGAVHVAEEGGGAYLVLQESDLFPWLSVRDNLLLGQKRSTLEPREYRRRMEEGLEELGLAEASRRFPAQLSGGQRQQVSVLRAFLSGAPVLLLDEPFSRLDAATRGRLQERTLALWERDRPAILFVTHDLAEAAYLGERLLLLDRKGHVRELPVDGSRPRDPWNPGLYTDNPTIREVLEVFREPRDGAEAPSALAPPRRRRLPSAATLLSPLAVLRLWEAAARFGWIDPRFFPGPFEALSTLAEMASSGDLWQHLRASLGRLAAGLAAGSAAGLALGLMMGMWPAVRRWVEPVVGMTYPIPKVAILPLLLLIFGLGEAPKVVIVAIGAFFLVLLNTMQGVIEVSRTATPVARNLKLRGWDYAVRTLLLGAMPWIFTGLRTATGYGLVLLVVAERDATDHGIGFLVWESWQLLYIDRMYAALLLLAVLGALLLAGVNIVAEGWSSRRGGTGGGGDTVRL